MILFSISACNNSSPFDVDEIGNYNLNSKENLDLKYFSDQNSNIFSQGQDFGTISCNDTGYSMFGSIGEGHNYILGKILSLNKADKQRILKNDSLLYTTIIQVLYSLDSTAYTIQELNSSIDVIDYYENLGVDYHRFNLFDSRLIINDLMSSGKISIGLANRLKYFYEIIFGSERNISEVFIELNNLDNYVYNENDQCYVDVFQSIFINSYNLWRNEIENNSEEGIEAYFTWKDLVTIGADAAGGVIGLGLGGLGSLIIGSYMSAVWVGINIPIN